MATAIWRRPYRMPGIRYIAILCVLLVLCYQIRTWGIEYTMRLRWPEATQPLETPGAQQEIRKDMPTHTQGEAPAGSPANIPLVHLAEGTGPRPDGVGTGPGGIPKKIWYKMGPRGLSEDARNWTSTCIAQNPDYHAEMFTDQSADEFVMEEYAERPDIVGTYLALTVPILKADMLRYLILYAEGGVWFDLDVSCEGTPIGEWIPEDFREDAGLVVGWEFDAGYEGAFDRQFTTWAMLSRKGVPHLMAVVDDIVQSVANEATRQNATISQLKMDTIPDVVDFTGPRRLAVSVMKNLEASLEEADGWSGWDDYYELLEPKLAGDVLILPGNSFSSQCNAYSAQDLQRVGPPLVMHHYAGSWKNAYGGETVEGQALPQ